MQAVCLQLAAPDPLPRAPGSPVNPSASGFVGPASCAWAPERLFVPEWLSTRRWGVVETSQDVPWGPSRASRQLLVDGVWTMKPVKPGQLPSNSSSASSSSKRPSTAPVTSQPKYRRLGHEGRVTAVEMGNVIVVTHSSTSEKIQIPNLGQWEIVYDELGDGCLVTVDKHDDTIDAQHCLSDLFTKVVVEDEAGSLFWRKRGGPEDVLENNMF